MPGTEETRPGPAWASSFTTGQRVVLAIASLIMLLMFALLGIAAVMHVANGIWLLLPVVVALFTSAAVMITVLLKRKS
jgi:succinate dehydrogenase/fumarate reductase cytochrome b subunit